MTLDQSKGAGTRDDRSRDIASITAAVLTAVERQMNRYFSAMTVKVDEALKAAETLRTEVRYELSVHIPRVESALQAQRAATEAYQHALHRALDDRLAEISAHHMTRLNDFDTRLTAVASQPNGVAPEDLLQIRQSMREDIWRSLAPVTERLDVLADANKRTDERASSLVEHVNTTTATLVTRIDDGDERVTHALRARVTETREALTRRMDAVETATDARATTTEERILELETASGARDASLGSDIAAVNDLLGESVATAGERMTELDKRLGSFGLDLATLTTKISSIDQDAIDDMKSQMSTAIGEAMLVRIELDRVVTNTDDKLDKTTVRLGEIEALLADEMDVGAAVQLERLDEIERAIRILDPAQFVRKDELLTRSSGSAVNPGPDGADSSREQELNGGPDHGDAPHGHNGDGTYGSSSDDTRTSDAFSASESWS